MRRRCPVHINTSHHQRAEVISLSAFVYPEVRNKIDSFFHLFRLGQNSGHLRFQRKLYKIIRSLSLQKKLVLLLVNRRQQGRPGKGKRA